jgi:LysM repeat protein
VQAPVFVNEQTKYVEDDPHCAEPCQAHPGECRAVHVVTRGDSVYRIAGRYHVAATSIFRANPWIAKQRNYWLYVGQKVCIP